MKSAREFADAWFKKDDGRLSMPEALGNAIEERDAEKIALFRAVVETVERAWGDRGYQAAFDALLARPEFQLPTPSVDPWIEAAWTELCPKDTEMRVPTLPEFNRIIAKHLAHAPSARADRLEGATNG